MKEKKHRLPLNCYTGRIRATFTLCINGKTSIFTDKSIVDEFWDILKYTKDKYHCKNWVYMFMPDHLHLILEGDSDNSDLWKAIVLFKQKTGFLFSEKRKEIRWQKDFYDHIHRKDEDLRKHIRYILDNPVRKGLVGDWLDYSFKGSLDFNLEEMVL